MDRVRACPDSTNSRTAEGSRAAPGRRERILGGCGGAALGAGHAVTTKHSRRALATTARDECRIGSGHALTPRAATIRSHAPLGISLSQRQVMRADGPAWTSTRHVLTLPVQQVREPVPLPVRAIAHQGRPSRSSRIRAPTSPSEPTCSGIAPRHPPRPSSRPPRRLAQDATFNSRDGLPWIRRFRRHARASRRGHDDRAMKSLRAGS